MNRRRDRTALQQIWLNDVSFRRVIALVNETTVDSDYIGLNFGFTKVDNFALCKSQSDQKRPDRAERLRREAMEKCRDVAPNYSQGSVGSYCNYLLRWPARSNCLQAGCFPMKSSGDYALF